MDMECETLFAVVCALKRRYGAILATHGNRTTDEWLHDYGPVHERPLNCRKHLGIAPRLWACSVEDE